MKGQLQKLRSNGFDESRHIPFTNTYRVLCSQCEALCISGTATHETGCPNQKHERRGCNARIDYRGYCEDCQ